jgi:hypothetical protein
VLLHSFRRDEERLSDLAVRHALGGEQGNPTLGRGQGVGSAQSDPVWPSVL